MLYRSLFVLLFIINILQLKISQSQVRKTDLIISLSGKQVQPLGKPLINSYGFDGQYFITNRLSLIGSFHFNNNYAHVPLGFASIAFLFYLCDGCQYANIDDSCVPIAALLFTEGISYHIPVFNQFTICPYINLLGMDYIFDKESYKDDFNLSGNVGFKMNLFFGNHIVVSPSAEYWRIYTESKGGVGVGIAIGYNFFEGKTNNLNK